MPTKRLSAEKKMSKTSMALPTEIWTAARIRALQEGINAQDLVARALTEYLKKKGGSHER
jgi:hypothetical protein